MSEATAERLKNAIGDYTTAYGDLLNILSKWEDYRAQGSEIDSFVFSFTPQTSSHSHHCRIYYLKEWEGVPDDDHRYDLGATCNSTLTRMGTLLNGIFVGLSPDQLSMLATFLASEGEPFTTVKLTSWAPALMANNWADDVYSFDAAQLAQSGYFAHPLINDAAWVAGALKIGRPAFVAGDVEFGEIIATAGGEDGRLKAFYVSLVPELSAEVGIKEAFVPIEFVKLGEGGVILRLPELLQKSVEATAAVSDRIADKEWSLFSVN